MLIIREQQHDAFRKAARARFVERMIAHARTHYCQEAARISDELPAVIERALETARSYGFIAERDACKFINLTMDFGSDFHREPRANVILNDRTMSNTHKVMMVRCVRSGTRVDNEDVP